MVDISWYIYGSGILWRCVFSISVYFFLHVLFYEFLTDCCFFNQQSHISCGPAPWPGQSSRSTVAGWKKNMHLIHKLSIMVNEFPLYYFIYIYICNMCILYIYILLYHMIICVCIIYICIIYIYIHTYIHIQKWCFSIQPCLVSRWYHWIRRPFRHQMCIILPLFHRIGTDPSPYLTCLSGIPILKMVV